MKRILIITDNIPDQVNGVVTTFNNLERMAQAQGYKMYFLTPLVFKHFSTPGYTEVKLSIPLGIGEKIEFINPDYIHIATEGPLGVAARLYCDKRGYRYNTSYHTRFPEYLKKHYYIPLWLTYAFVRWFHKHSGKVLTTTDTMVKELYDRKFNGNIISWSRGVDREYLTPNEEYTHNNNIPIVLYVGRVSKEKNLDSLCKLENNYNIIIVGDGPARKRLQSIYTKVNFTGYKKGTELANYYSQADVFCFPSKTDTFGIVMIEAISLGTPVAGYPVPGPLDVVTPFINGHLSNELGFSIKQCLKLNRDKVKESSRHWTWAQCWNIFEKNLVNK
jgi:glycosyltransferase involved in cell wall biosynthesis